MPTPPAPKRLTPQQAAALAGETSKLVAQYAEQSGRGREAFPALVLRALKQARYDPRNLGHSGLASDGLLPLHLADPPLPRPDRAPRAPARARPVRRSAARRPASTSPSTRSAREREAGQLEYLADDICLAWLLERRLYELGWEERFEGEITGLIGSGLFIRFAEVFEGFLPARRLHGEFFELNQLGTALAGRTTGRTYRLGDPIEVRVESIARNEGKVELALGRGAR